MERIWCYKAVESLTEKQKNEILEVVFKNCAEEDIYEYMGETIFYFLMNKKLLWEEELLD